MPRVAMANDGDGRRCDVCLEAIPALARVCPECGEPTGHAGARPTDRPIRSWLSAHWRPSVTVLTLAGLLGFGVALRTLAPEAYRPIESRPPAGVTVTEPVCDVPCWSGEACELGKCVFRAGNDVGHLPVSLNLSGPFQLPEDAVDFLPLDGERYLLAGASGIQVRSTRSGELLSTVTEAPLVHRLDRVGDVVYASASQRIYVLDAATTSIRKTIEVGRAVGDLAVGAAGSRVIVSLPAARAVAVIATDYHAEIARFSFGDDQVAVVAIDDAGKRAMTTNGSLPLPGMRAAVHSNEFGGAYAFDPTRLPTEQDRVRSGLEGNPVDVLMAPDGTTSFAVLRERNELVPLDVGAGGTLRALGHIPTCPQPEQVALVRDGRRALVRCNAGRAVDVIDLARREPLRRIEANGRATDLAVSPDGQQAVIALPREVHGAVGLLDLKSYELRLVELDAEGNRVRLAPDGRTAVVTSERSRAAWVLR